MTGIFAVLVCSLAIYQVHGQIGIIPKAASTPANCQYTFNVPNAQGACSTSTALNTKVNQVKQDLDRTRLQYVAQNSVLQGTLAKVQSDTGSYMSKVNDLNLELQKIKQALNNLPSGTVGNPVNSQNLNKLVHDAKDLLTTSLRDINNKIYNLTYSFQRNSVEESKVNTAIEGQINQQALTIALQQQRVVNLEKLLQNIQLNGGGKPSSGAASNPITNAQIQQLEQNYLKLQADVLKLDQQSTNQLKALETKTNTLSSQLTTQATDISNVKTASLGALNRLQSVESNANKTKTDLDAFEKKINPQMIIVQQEVSDIGKNVTRVEGGLQQLGTQLLNGRMQSMKDHAEISGLKTQATLLATRFANLTTEISAQGGELLKLSADLKALTSIPAAGSNGTASNVALQTLVNKLQAQTTTSLTKTQADIVALQQVTSVLLKQVTSILTRPSG